MAQGAIDLVTLGSPGHPAPELVALSVHPRPALPGSTSTGAARRHQVDHRAGRARGILDPLFLLLAQVFELISGRILVRHRADHARGRRTTGRNLRGPERAGVVHRRQPRDVPQEDAGVRRSRHRPVDVLPLGGRPAPRRRHESIRLIGELIPEFDPRS